MLKYCPTHGIGYESKLDPVCPQCSVGRMAPPEALDVDVNVDSPGYGFPKQKGAAEGDRNLNKVR